MTQEVHVLEQEACSAVEDTQSFFVDLLAG
jgi:hypothetical protein